MRTFRLPLLGCLLVCAVLAACSHARIVRREGEPPRGNSRISRPATVPPRAAQEPLPQSGYHVVQSGETLYGISFRFGLRYQDVAGWNHLDDANVIHVGQRLLLRPPDAIRVTAPVEAGRSTTATKVAPSAATPVSAALAQPEPALATGGPAWRWPTSGQIVGRFVSGDPTKQGIDLAGTAGQPVVAAADGVVVYSGAGLVGYGELIIIKHSDQWLSAYAHNRRRLVAEGVQVKAGDRVAEMGDTGATRDMLHFEIRLNGRPVDPLRFLPQP